MLSANSRKQTQPNERSYSDHMQIRVLTLGGTLSVRKLEAKEDEITVLQQKVGQLTIECDWLKKKYNEIFGPEGAPKTRFTKKQKTDG